MLSELEMYYETAEELGVMVHDAHFSETKKAASLCDDGVYVLLDKPEIETAAELLGRELKQIENGDLFYINSASNTPMGRLTRRKCENKSKWEFVQEILPPNELQNAILSDGPEYWRIAEGLSRTVKFVMEAIEMYERKGFVFKTPVYEC